MSSRILEAKKTSRILKYSCKCRTLNIWRFRPRSQKIRCLLLKAKQRQSEDYGLPVESYSSTNSQSTGHVGINSIWRRRPEIQGFKADWLHGQWNQITDNSIKRTRYGKCINRKNLNMFSICYSKWESDRGSESIHRRAHGICESEKPWNWSPKTNSLLIFWKSRMGR